MDGMMNVVKLVDTNMAHFKILSHHVLRDASYEILSL